MQSGIVPRCASWLRICAASPKPSGVTTAVASNALQLTWTWRLPKWKRATQGAYINQKAGTNSICLALGHAQPDPSANAVRVGGGPESLALDAPYEPIDSLHERRAVRRTVVLIVIPRAIAQRIVGPV